MPEVLGHDQERAWLLLADAGTNIGSFGNPPESWLALLPLYAELQRSEVAHTADHLAHGVPDLRVETLPTRYDELVQQDLRLRKFTTTFERLCTELAARGIPESIQHDDLHMNNVYDNGERLRVLDYKRLLAEAEKAKAAAQEKMEQLRKKQSEADAQAWREKYARSQS